MLIQFKNYSGAAELTKRDFTVEWNELEEVLKNMPLHLKASEQAQITGRPIFDPVGTNEYIKTQLTKSGWITNISIPKEFSFLGTDIDFAKNGTVVEAQFSNYPFLLNNLIRSELLVNAKVKFDSHDTVLLMIITKGVMFPSSNSTLYYEQAVKQLDSLSKYDVFKIPIRLIGFFEEKDVRTSIVWTEYASTRSRTVKKRFEREAEIKSGTTRCKIEIID